MADPADTPAYDPDYHEDFVRWTEVQARRLQDGPRNADALDTAHLAEEIADLGKRDLRELLQRLTVLVEHLVKLQASPARDPRGSWRRTVRTQRREIRRLLEASPSLAAKLDERDAGGHTRLDRVREDGWTDACASLRDDDGLSDADLPGRPAASLDRLLDDAWMPGD